MKLIEICRELEKLAPPSLQESYDNAGLLTGSPDQEVSGVICSLDVVEEIVDEAIAKGCNLIVAHHPIIFSGLKRLTGKNYVERTVIKAIKHDIAIYAIHTNLDNVKHGVNAMIAERLGVLAPKILAPKPGILRKLSTYVPSDHLETVRSALFAAGAGQIGNYSECSFSLAGIGTFKGNEHSDPSHGEKGHREDLAEHKLEVLVAEHQSTAVLSALRKAHPYEEVAYEMIALDNLSQDHGSGMYGKLPKPMAEEEFLSFLKESFGLDCIRHTALLNKKVELLAFCGGSGQFLLPAAKQIGADVYISGDFKYHEFFDAENDILIADIGHYESEQFTPLLIQQYLSEKFSNFAFHLTVHNTNPIKYF